MELWIRKLQPPACYYLTWKLRIFLYFYCLRGKIFHKMWKLYETTQISLSINKILLGHSHTYFKYCLWLCYIVMSVLNSWDWPVWTAKNKDYLAPYRKRLPVPVVYQHCWITAFCDDRNVLFLHCQIQYALAIDILKWD